VSFKSRMAQLSHAWNAFLNLDWEAARKSYDGGVSYGIRPDRVRLAVTSERSIISSVITRLSIDVSSMDIRHVRLDKNDRYLDDINSGLNECFKTEANIDQAPQDFFQDVALTLFDKGVAAVVPVDTTLDPSVSGSFDIKTLRVGEVTGWYPKHVKVSVYNEDKAVREELMLEKKFVAIVYNPLAPVMNEKSSTLQRLIRKLNLLDVVDEQSSSGKLDIIIQLPYTIRSDARRQAAEQRRKDIEFQLKGSQYGIAYADATEKITQLNRPAENNLLEQVKYLTEMLYSQLGLTPAVMDGTADEKVMINYYNRTIEPIVNAIVQGMRRTFLTKTARFQGQSIRAFRNPFKLVPIAEIAEIADKFTRARMATANDLRVAIGWKPSSDPEADKLTNPNMPAPSEPTTSPPIVSEGGDRQNGRS
jgi:hypothetical protein